MRTGLVSFGQGLYYCLGAYAAGTLDHFFSLSDLLLMVVAGALLAAVVAGILGLLLAKYRDIFFAMLSLAFSMILYGLLVKTSQLGSTDGFGLSVKTFAGIALSGAHARYAIFAFAAVLAFVCAVFMHRYWNSHLGRLATAIRDNELAAASMAIPTAAYMILAFAWSGLVVGTGGALYAVLVRQVSPEAFNLLELILHFGIVLIGGLASLAGSVLGAVVLTMAPELLRDLPGYEELAIACLMIVILLFLPGGLVTLLERVSPAFSQRYHRE